MAPLVIGAVAVKVAAASLTAARAERDGGVARDRITERQVAALGNTRGARANRPDCVASGLDVAGRQLGRTCRDALAGTRLQEERVRRRV